MDASEIFSKRLNAKEVIFPKEKGEFIFPIADGRISTLGGDQDLRTSTFDTASINSRSRAILIFLENQKDLFHHLTTHFRMPVKRLMIFVPYQENSFSFITLNPESNFTRREKNHSLFHLSTLTYPELLIQIWMSNERNASMMIGISMGLETCRILGQVSPNFFFLEEKTSRRIFVVRGEINEKTAYIQARSFMARNLENNGKECQAEGEAKVVT